jgi:hypothetical protein
MKGNAVASIARLVPVALHAVPSNVTADGRAERQRRHRDGTAAGNAKKLDPSAGRAMQNGYRTQGARNNDAISHESALQLALGNF